MDSKLNNQMEDQVIDNVDSQLGYTIEDTAEVTQSQAINSIPNNTAAKTHMPDVPWTVDDLVKRTWQVIAYDWKTTDVIGKQIFKANVVRDLFNTELQETGFDTFHFFRFSNIKLRFQVVSNPMIQGKLVACYTPTQGYVTAIKTRQNAIQVNHVHINASTNDIVELNIPFHYYKDYIDLDSKDPDFGFLEVIVYNVLRTGTTGSNTAVLNIWAQIEDPEFHIPRLDRATRNRRANRAIRKQVGFLDNFAKGFADGAKSVVSVGKTLNEIKDAYIPEDIASYASFLLDKPQLPKSPENIVRKEQRFTNFNKNPDYVDSLTLNPTAIQVVPGCNDDNKTDEMSLKYLCIDKRNLYFTYNIAPTTTSGSRLVVVPVTPYDSSTERCTINYYALASGAMYWNGSFKVTVEMIATRFHEARLAVVYMPSTLPSDVPTQLSEVQSQYIATMQVKDGQMSAVYTAPFLSETPVKRVQDLNEDFTTSNTVGSIAIYLAAPLVHPDNVSSIVDLNIYRSLGDDFEFHLPSYNLVKGSVTPRSRDTFEHITERSAPTQPMDIPKRSFVRKQMYIDMNTSPSESDATSLGTMSGTVPSMVKHIDDPVQSLRELAKRQSHVHSTTQKIPTNVPYPLTFGIPLSEGNWAYKNFLEKILAPYRNITGSLVVTIRPMFIDLDTNNYNAYYTFTGTLKDNQPDIETLYGSIPHIGGSGPRVGGAIAWTLGNERQSAEFKVPYNNLNNSGLLQTYEFIPVSNLEDMYRMNIVYSVASQSPGEIASGHVITMGFSDETNLTGFIGAPDIYRAD